MDGRRRTLPGRARHILAQGNDAIWPPFAERPHI